MTYLACLAVGFLAGFTGGFRVAALIRLGVQQLAARAGATLPQER